MGKTSQSERSMKIEFTTKEAGNDKFTHITKKLITL